MFTFLSCWCNLQIMKNFVYFILEYLENYLKRFLASFHNQYHANHKKSLYFFHHILQFDSVFLEAQVQNITTNPISMDHVTLDPSQYYMVLPLNELTPVGGETVEKGVDEIFDSTYINPMDMRQYLYKLIPKESHKLELRAMVCRNCFSVSRCKTVSFILSYLILLGRNMQVSFSFFFF